ncbi:MAG: PEP-CTERM sorting domain-containing protein [Rubrivivax sp.]
MKLNILSTGIALALALTAGSAMAAPINGTASLAGFFQNVSSSNNRIVSDLNFIDLINTAGAALVGGTTGDFAPNGNGTASDFTISPFVPGMIYAFNGFSFTVQSINSLVRTPLSCGTTGCNDTLTFDIFGTVTKAGFDSTLFSGAWSGNGSCNQNGNSGNCTNGTKSASWSVSLSAAGMPAVVPEPGSLALVGVALAGFGVAARRKTRG